MLNEEIDYILFQDENIIRNHQTIQFIWFLRRRQKIIPNYRNRQSIKLIGLSNNKNRETVCVEK